jgi:cytidylate kinase
MSGPRNPEAPIIAIDGPSGSGKSSTARGVAVRLGLKYVDTGAMYRAMTWWLLEQNVNPSDSAAVAARCGEPVIDITTDPLDPRIFIAGRDVSTLIRGPQVTEAVSLVSAVPQLRERLVQRQRTVCQEAIDAGIGIVMEGRDIGTVVLPHADVKIFLTADARVRARRRAVEEAARGSVMDSIDQHAGVTEESLRKRDALDSTRTISPLTAADDALAIDGSRATLEEVIDQVIAAVGSSAGRHK